jgi:hypothetical protein
LKKRLVCRQPNSVSQPELQELGILTSQHSGRS